MSDYTGSCHCGQIEYTVKLPEAKTILCHCNACKKMSGTAYTLNAIVPKTDLTVTKGELKPYIYKGDSGNAVNCYYCPNCTSHVYHHAEANGPDTIIVRTALLNGGADFEPQIEIYGKDRISWQKEVAKTFESMPPH